MFAQARSRLAAFAYAATPLAVAGDRKSCWQLGEQAEHATHRRMRALLAEYARDWQVVLNRLQRFILAHLGDLYAILVLDETAKLKKGTMTVGVARQQPAPPARSTLAQGATRRSQIAFIRGTRTALRRIVVPVAWKTASNEEVKFEQRSRSRNLMSANRSPRLRTRLRPAARSTRRWVCGDAAQVHPAAAVLDEHSCSVEYERSELFLAEQGFCGLRRGSIPQNQHVQSLQQHGVHVQEVDRDDPRGPGCQELPPRRARLARRRIDARSTQDLPHRGRRHRHAELDQFAVDPAVSPPRILPGRADDQAGDARDRRRATGLAPPARVVLAASAPPGLIVSTRLIHLGITACSCQCGRRQNSRTATALIHRLGDRRVRGGELVKALRRHAEDLGRLGTGDRLGQRRTRVVLFEQVRADRFDAHSRPLRHPALAARDSTSAAATAAARPGPGSARSAGQEYRVPRREIARQAIRRGIGRGQISGS